jgi:hypothetical protein
MFGRKKISWMAALLLFAAVGSASAQTDGTYGGFSPYSVFGVGQLHQSGTAWNRGMGGVGIAARSNRFVNIMNPASVTARDSLSFMSDLGLNGRISVFQEGSKRAANTIFNIDDFVISFPMWQNTAFMTGIRPMSDVGYRISASEVNVDTGTQTFVSAGNGGIYEFFAAAGITLWDRLSLGAQFNYHFGNVNKKAALTYSDASYRSANSGDSLQVRSFTAKLGLQYVQPLSKSASLTFGATYQFSSPMKGYSIHYRELGSYDRTRSSATLDENGLRMGDELGLGIAYKFGDKFMAEFDYTREGWANTRLDQVSGFSNQGDVTFAPGVGQSFRAGMEYTPNRSDIRYYFRRCTYRAGAYFDQSYYLVDGVHVNSVGVTLGMTLPVFRWYNGLSLGVDFGRRGLATSQVKENYFGFSVGFNVFDIWFQKRPYE